MKSRTLQLALREWTRELRSSLVWTIIAGITAILAIIGPFETGPLLSFAERLVYWGTIVAGSYLLGAIIHTVANARHEERPSVKWIGAVLPGALTGLTTLGLVCLVNVIAFGFIPQGYEWLDFALATVGISIIVSLLLTQIRLAVISRQSGTAETPSLQPNNITPSLLSRIPLEKRGILRAISVEDHYVRIYTDKGDTLILLRLSDAIKETEGVSGAQVHRSHWVNFDAIRSVSKTAGRADLTLDDGLTIPVSRANLPKLKTAGLLPK